jgi:hypothetical protein
MKYTFQTTLSIAAISAALVIPALAQSDMQPQQDPQAAAQPSTQPLRGEHEAMKMVPAQVALKAPLNAAKDKPGAQFQTVLAKKVTLQNGAELPAGTVLLGMVADDDMNVTGDTKLVLRFTDAVMKNGETIPIRATIVGAYQPEQFDSEGNTVAPGREMPNNWTDQTLGVDEVGVIGAIDLHSKIASKNSGVFVSTKDHDVKLPAGSELALAIAPRTPEQASVQPPPQH